MFLGDWLAAVGFGWGPLGLTGLGWTDLYSPELCYSWFGFMCAHVPLAKGSQRTKLNSSRIDKHSLSRDKTMKSSMTKV